MRLAVLCSRIRVEEKLLLAELERRGVAYDRIDDSELVLRLDRRAFPYDTIFERSISYGRSLYAIRTLESWGVRCLNRAEVIATCGDKLLTSLALEREAVARLFMSEDGAEGAAAFAEKRPPVWKGR